MARGGTGWRWPVRLFWAWQGFYFAMILMVLAAVALDGAVPPGNALVDALGYPALLAPVLGPVWFPVTIILGIMVALGRRTPAQQ